MTDNEKLQAWQLGAVFNNIPDYLTDDTACMSLLDTLAEQEYYPELFYCLGHKWNCTISDDGDLVVQGRSTTRRAAVVAACLELIGKEDA